MKVLKQNIILRKIRLLPERRRAFYFPGIGMLLYFFFNAVLKGKEPGSHGHYDKKYIVEKISIFGIVKVDTQIHVT